MRTHAEYPLHVLRDYALLADGERGILVGPRGEHAWMCAPAWDSEAVFGTLIGGGGLYAVTPVETPFVWGGYYGDATLIWHNRWVTGSRIIECREALRMPADPHTAVVLRRIEAIDGDARVRALLDPRAGFGRHRLSRLRRRDGVWAGRCGELYVRWSGAPDAVEFDGGGLEALIDVPEGGHHDLVLEISDQPMHGDPTSPGTLWQSTEQAWSEAVPPIEGTVADRDARHAYAVLCGLTSRQGGMVAGATTCLPERAEAGRNYDYRFAWIRDQSYAGQAVAALGPHAALLTGAVDFVADRLAEDGPRLRPAYTVRGGPVPAEAPVDLPGYPGAAPVTGNNAHGQFQLDAFGEALLLFAAAAGHDRLDARHWKAVEAAANAISERGAEPDSGIWELDEQRWTHSRLICVAGLRAVSRYAPRGQAARWSTLADAMLAEADADCLHSSGRWQRSPKDERIDAALVLPAVRGGVPADDPRTRATLEAVLGELSQDEFVYRFRLGGRPLGEGEGAFLLCGFATSLALHQQGDLVRASRWFERSRSACGSPGLLAEEYDVEQRQLRGNLPQAFVHAVLLEAAARLARPPSAMIGGTDEEH
ncbi:glycoside hydrolase family 15 protein [Actinospica sp.]|uniref:glycoside hydrolase family 15 protein n=1 Tax=Actinospica sp. TaxID=1872142 RepID=UPI002C3E67A7|nr:glycoside hydrolase family 15 protein [Actinospica sp.]HWG23686.1 glycoside hydrolase family 15 protein [Actinospica sp.]